MPFPYTNLLMLRSIKRAGDDARCRTARFEVAEAAENDWPSQGLDNGINVRTMEIGQVYVQINEGGHMGDSNRSRSRRHPTRESRCRRIWANARRPEMAFRMTRELPTADIGQHRSDFAVRSPASREWLMSRCTRLELVGQQRWPS
jgi:hypothetical protein